MSVSLPMIEDLLRGHGLMLRGCVDLGESDAIVGPIERPARSVLLVGSGGGAYWEHFRRWHDARRNQPNPLDTWSREVIDGIALRLGARTAYPSDRPYMPFQRWAMRAEGLRPSPLGILMHPRFGLWHAYRGALLFDSVISVEPTENVIHLCDACVGKPCKRACPVDAHLGDGFAYEACLDHVRSANGTACLSGGCLDRDACPHVEWRYPAEAVAFHMVAFAGRH